MTQIGSIGGRAITTQELRQFLSITGELPHALARMAAMAAVTLEARARDLAIGNEELQKLANDFRVQNGLLKSADVDAYLAARGWTVHEFEMFLEQNLLRVKLRDAIVPSDRVVSHYQENLTSYRSLALSHILCQSMEIAEEVFSQIRDNEISFYDAARKYSMEPVSGLGGGFIGFFRVAQMPREIHGVLLAAKPGDLLGPLPAARGFSILRVEAVKESELTDEIILEIKEALFSEWLDGYVKELNPHLLVQAEEPALASAPA